MKTVILSIVFLASSSAMAFVDFPSMQFPTESGWAKAMTAKACGVKFAKSATGRIQKHGDGSVRYTVYNSHGKVIAMADASSSYIGAEKVCLSVMF